MDANQSGKLPALPASDPVSISVNKFDTNYGVRSADFWGANEVNRNEVTPFKECNHYFEYQEGHEIKCSKCHFGLSHPSGEFQLEIRDGKLHHKGEPLGL